MAKKPSKLAPGMFVTLVLCYFTEGFVDIVGVVSNMVQKDLGQTHTQASLMPSMVFIWFLILSVPAGLLTNRIGRRKMVLGSIFLSILALVLPLLGYSYPVILLAMMLVGIGHVALQVSLKPLVSTMVPGDDLAGIMSFGQFTKAIASLTAPIIASLGAIWFAGGIGWRLLLPVFMVIGCLAFASLSLSKVHEPSMEDNQNLGVKEGFQDCLKLLGSSLVLLTFVAILCHVGVNVGMNISSPKILMERCGLPLEKAALASTAYFLSRTVSSFCTPFILRLVPGRKYLTVCLSLMTLGLLAMAFGRNAVLLYSGICLVGFGGVNIYPLIFSNAILKVEDKKRNVFSSLMAMAFIGGAIFPTLMGVAGDRFGQIGAVAMMAVGLAYLWFYSRSEARN